MTTYLTFKHIVLSFSATFLIAGCTQDTYPPPDDGSLAVKAAPGTLTVDAILAHFVGKTFRYDTRHGSPSAINSSTAKLVYEQTEYIVDANAFQNTFFNEGVSVQRLESPINAPADSRTVRISFVGWPGRYQFPAEVELAQRCSIDVSLQPMSVPRPGTRAVLRALMVAGDLDFRCTLVPSWASSILHPISRKLSAQTYIATGESTPFVGQPAGTVLVEFELPDSDEGKPSIGMHLVAFADVNDEGNFVDEWNPEPDKKFELTLFASSSR